MNKNKETTNFFKTPLFYTLVLTFLISISTPGLNVIYDYLDDSQIKKESIQDLFSVASFSIVTILGIVRERFKINKDYLELANMAVNRDELMQKVKKGRKVLTTPPKFPGRTNLDD